MRPALYTILVGVTVLAFVGAVLVVSKPTDTFQTRGEQLFIRCGPRDGYTPPSDCPPWSIETPRSSPSRRPYGYD
jgi:hypothetical protein